MHGTTPEMLESSSLPSQGCQQMPALRCLNLLYDDPACLLVTHMNSLTMPSARPCLALLQVARALFRLQMLWRRCCLSSEFHPTACRRRLTSRQWTGAEQLAGEQQTAGIGRAQQLALAEDWVWT